MNEVGRNPTDRAASDIASVEEVYAAVEALTEADHARLGAYARLRLQGCSPGVLKGRESGDLVCEAMLKTLDESRVWRRSVPLVKHLIGVMRSTASHWEETAAAERTEPASAVGRDSDDGEQADVVEAAASTDPGPDQLATGREELNALLEHFKSDDLADLLIAGLAEGYRASELSSVLGISEKECAAGMKRLRRQARRLREGGGKP